jgi:cytochrome c biogenesis protein CcmG/thiol:disulfide interchange protein DsbE
MNKQRLFLFAPLVIFLILGILFWRGLSLDPTAMPSALLNKALPEFDLPLVAAPENPKGMVRATQSDLVGKVALLNVWATWCVTCKEEHEFLNILKSEGVPIYGINYKDKATAAEKWLLDLHNPYVFSVTDKDGRLGINLGVYGAPETYILDKAGIIRHKHVGDVNETNWNAILKPIYDSLLAQ